MIKKVDQKTMAKVWPFKEAAAVLKKIKNQTPNKGYVLLETGYGPSGLPHIGTFGEVVKTYFIKKALNYMAPDIKVKILVVSDDYDGMRKIPENVPKKDMLENYIDMPLTKIPHPFDDHADIKSYGHYMNKKLRDFLDNLNFEYEFASASELYANGKFDDYLKKAAEKYDKIMQIMLPTLGEERQKTYSIFMPVDNITGKVLAQGVKKVDPVKHTVTYVNTNGEEVETPVTGGKCKLQWKPDFAMRWAALDVDYELYGKDHYPNEPHYRSICKALGKEPPVNFFYELFLDKEGRKISKSKGNGVSIDQWLKYVPKEALSLYMYIKPKVAKRLHFDVIPQTFDEYLDHLRKYLQCEQEEDRVKSPIFFVGAMEGKVPSVSFSMMLNMVSVVGDSKPEVLWHLLSKYDNELRPGYSKILDFMVNKALLYYKEIVAPTRITYEASESDRAALIAFKERLIALDSSASANDIQNIVHDIVPELNIDSKQFFVICYKMFFGQDQGPRIGSFVKVYGIDGMIELINNKL